MLFHNYVWKTCKFGDNPLYLGAILIVINHKPEVIIRKTNRYIPLLIAFFALFLGCQTAFAQKNPNKVKKKGTEEYHCSGPGCQVPQHNHHYYVPHKNPNRMATLKSRKIKHRDLSKMRQKNMELAHKNMNRHKQKAAKSTHRDLSGKQMKSYEVRHKDLSKATMRPYTVKHQDLNNKSMKSYKVRHQDLANKNQKAFQAITHKNLSNKQQKYLRIAHKSLENHAQKYERVPHRNLNRYFQRGFETRHKNLEAKNSPFGPLASKEMRRKQKSSIRQMRSACYPTVRLNHKDLTQVCYPKFRLNHKDLSEKCYPKFTVKHKDLQSKCYPTPKIKHRDLSAECLPKYKIKHEDLSTVCYKPGYRVRHQDLNTKCLPTWTIKHKDFERYTCTEIHINHVPLSKYRVLCDPNIREHPSTMERIGVEVKDIFTRKRLFCKLENRYSGVSQGCVVETSVGTAVVKDYVVKKHTYYPLNLIVEVAKEIPHIDNEPQLKKFKLSREETKEIMIRELIKRGKFIWLVRMYPEERKNLKELKDLYLNPGNNTDPNGTPDINPPGTPDLNNGN